MLRTHNLKINQTIILTLCLLFCCSCSRHRDNKIIASIGDDVISTATIDKIVEKELYYNLCNIYDAREAALRNYLELIALRKYAEEKGLSADSIISVYYTNTDIHADNNTKSHFIDSLFSCYNVKIRLKEPISPIINIDSAIIYSRGNSNSKVILTLVSDYNCGMCFYMYKNYKEMLHKYGDRILYKHTNFSQTISPASLAAYAAGLQDKYWEMSDTLMLMPKTADSAKVMSIATSIGLDMDQFINDYMSDESKEILIRNSTYLSKKGITRTPTILLNGHILRKPEDIEYITKQIEIALNE